MTPRVRRVLMWSGLFFLAFAGGSWLGRFTANGLVSEKPAQGMTDSAEFWAARDQARAARAGAPPAPVQRFVTGIPEAHDCDGCDASLARNRQMAQYIASQYGDLLGSGDAPVPDAMKSPVPPPTPPLPPVAPSP